MSRRAHIFRAAPVMLVAVALCSGCSSATEPEAEIVPGVIAPGNGIVAQVISAPDTVRAGEQFTAIVTTFGSSTCTRALTTTAYMGGELADLSVWDEQRIGIPCTRDISPIPRSVPIRFTNIGAATIRVRGRALTRNAAGQDSAVVVERLVIVQ
jgi:hypothetical protein